MIYTVLYNIYCTLDPNNGQRVFEADQVATVFDKWRVVSGY